MKLPQAKTRSSLLPLTNPSKTRTPSTTTSSFRRNNSQQSVYPFSISEQPPIPPYSHYDQLLQLQMQQQPQRIYYNENYVDLGQKGAHITHPAFRYWTPHPVNRNESRAVLLFIMLPFMLALFYWGSSTNVPQPVFETPKYYDPYAAQKLLTLSPFNSSDDLDDIDIDDEKELGQLSVQWSPKKDYTLEEITNTQFSIQRERYAVKMFPKKSVSLIAACRDRTSFLIKSLPTWISALSKKDEIILVDWSTSGDLLKIRDLDEVKKEPRITVVTVDKQDHWVLSRAYNLAASLATRNILLKVDCDTILEPDFLSTHNLYKAPNSYYRLDWSKNLTENEKHLNGVFMIQTSNFHLVNGYDERLTTYGWDDSDLYSRLDQQGLKRKPLDTAKIHHAPHNDATRAANQVHVRNPMFETQFNSLLLEQLPKWVERAQYDTCTYQMQSNSPDSRYVSALTKRLSPPATSLIPEEVQKSMEKIAGERVMHDIYGVPWDAIHETRGSIVNLVDALHSANDLNSSSFKRHLFVELGGNMVSRMLGLSYALALATQSFASIFISFQSLTSSDGKIVEMQFSDFFDMESHNLKIKIGESERDLAVFQLKRWKCQGGSKTCSGWDDAFSNIVDINFDVKDDIKDFKRAVEAAPENKHLMLKISAGVSFPNSEIQTDSRVAPLSRFIPTSKFHNVIRSLQPNASCIGVHIGQSVAKSLYPNLVRRIKNLATGLNSTFFVVGDQYEDVLAMRSALKGVVWPSDEDQKALYARFDNQISSNPAAVPRYVIETAEIFAVGMFCKSVLNEGKVSAHVIDLVSLLGKVGSFSDYYFRNHV